MWTNFYQRKQKYVGVEKGGEKFECGNLEKGLRNVTGNLKTQIMICQRYKIIYLLL